MYWEFGLTALVGALCWLVGRELLSFCFQKISHRDQVKANQTREQELLRYRVLALERLVLLVERMRPEGLVHRLGSEAQSAAQQVALMAQLRAEMEHNLAQQIYVSRLTWQLITQARDEVLGLVQQAGVQTPVDAPAIAFSRQLLLLQQQQGSAAIDKALDALRNELQVLLKA